MKRIACATLVAMVVGSPAAWAEEVDSYIDAYAVPFGQLNLAGTEEDGIGWGTKAGIALTEMLYARAEFQGVRYDFAGTALEVESSRVGGGFVYPLEFAFIEGVHVDAEYIGMSLVQAGAREEGYGVHVGVTGNVMDALAVYASVGHLNVGALGDGLEYLVGTSGNLTPKFGWFADYRLAQLEDTFEYEPSELRVGLRLQLGTSGSLFGASEAPARKR